MTFRGRACTMVGEVCRPPPELADGAASASATGALVALAGSDTQAAAPEFMRTLDSFTVAVHQRIMYTADTEWSFPRSSATYTFVDRRVSPTRIPFPSSVIQTVT